MGEFQYFPRQSPAELAAASTHRSSTGEVHSEVQPHGSNDRMDGKFNWGPIEEYKGLPPKVLLAIRAAKPASTTWTRCAELVGISVYHMSDIKDGQCRPGRTVAGRIAEVFALPADIAELLMAHAGEDQAKWRVDERVWMGNPDGQ